MTTQIKDATGATVTRMTFDDIVGTAGTSNSNVMSIQGVASGTAVTVSFASAPSVTIGTALPAGAALIGSVGITLGGNALSAGVSNTDNVAGIGAATLINTVGYGRIYNGTTWDRARKTNVYKRVASSATSGNPDFLKASAGDLTQFWGVCGITAAFLQIYNKASAPTIGTDTPILTYPIPANGIFTQTLPGGAYFSTGIAFAFTTDAAGTTGSAAAAVTSFAIMGA